MFTHLCLSARVSPVNQTLGRVITKHLPFLGWILFWKPNTLYAKLHCLSVALEYEEGSVMITREVTGPCMICNHAFQLTETEQRTKPNSSQCLNPWTLQSVSELPGQLASHRKNF